MYSTSNMGVLGLAAHEGGQQLSRSRMDSWASNPWSVGASQALTSTYPSVDVSRSISPSTESSSSSSPAARDSLLPVRSNTPLTTSPGSGAPSPPTGSPSATVQPGTNNIAQELYRLFVSQQQQQIPPPPPAQSSATRTALDLLALDYRCPSSALALHGSLPPPTSHHHQVSLPPALDHPLPAIGGGTSWEEFNRNGRDSEMDDLDRLLRGLEVRDPRHVMSLPDYVDVDQGDDDVLTKSRLFEILRERERIRLVRRRGMLRAGKPGKVCVFCRNNGESESVYTSHQLKDADGKITCPVLYIYTCPICGASGPHAHTIKYCPRNTGDTPDVLRSLKTARNSMGRRTSRMMPC